MNKDLEGFSTFTAGLLAASDTHAGEAVFFFFFLQWLLEKVRQPEEVLVFQHHFFSIVLALQLVSESEVDL